VSARAVCRLELFRLRVVGYDADSPDGRAILAHFRKSTPLHRITFKSPVTHASFSPDGKYIAVTFGRKVQVWKTPSMVVREFAGFVLHREYTGHQDEVEYVGWSKTSR
jgi:periodic tryptophan protein 2